MGRSKYIYYGGSFDPFHNGHLQVVNWLNENYENVIISVSKNRYKQKSYYSYDLRFNAIKELFKNNSKIIIETIPEEKSLSTYDSIVFLENKYKNQIDIAIGNDCLKNIEYWDQYEKLKLKKMIVFERHKEWPIVNFQYEKIILLNLPQISSSIIKEKKDFLSIPEQIRKFYQKGY